MIRFNCANCGRRHELPPALARLRILCKGCGQPLSVPEVGDEPDPPDPEPEPPPPAKPSASPAPSPPKAPPPAADRDDEPLFEKEPDLDSDAAGKASPHPKPSATKAVPAPSPAPRADRTANLLPVVVDVAVGLVLLAGGVLLGEVLARKSTAEVWRNAGAAVAFPPVDLLVWAGPPVLAVLAYGLLAGRGLSAGGWLRRRAAR